MAFRDTRSATAEPEADALFEGAAAASDPEARLQQALDVAYRYLGRRDRTVAEVRRKLEAERVEPAVLDAALEELAEAGYLDDARYAVRFAEDRRTLDAWGADRIERKLRSVGVASAHIDAAIAAQDSAGELEAAVEVLRRRFSEPPTDDRTREKALAMLVRKGYELELAYDAVRALGRESA